ncbi:MAG: hypothetical protein SFY95_08270 [Planctomycetota bacterium]|nr:hypothetical protein [Planctomycetota bacterium]
MSDTQNDTKTPPSEPGPPAPVSLRTDERQSPRDEGVPWVGIVVVAAALVGTIALWMMPLRHPAFWPTAAVVALAVVGGTWFGKRTGR